MTRRSKRTSTRHYLASLSRGRWTAALVFAVVACVFGSWIVLSSLAASSYTGGGGYYGGGGGGDDSGPTPSLPAVTPNPNFTNNTCGGGLNIAIVADMSGSVADSSEFGDLTSALNDFVSSLLPGPNMEISLTEFGDNATILTPLTNNVGTLDNAIGQLSNQGSTNWDVGLTDGYSTLTNLTSKAPRILILATDGYPNQPGGSGTALYDAAVEANTIKAAGVHILAVGLGDDVAVNNLEAISGTNVSEDGTGADIDTDVITGGTYAELDKDLLEIAAGTCGSGAGSNGTGTGNGGTGTGTGTGGTGSGSGGSGQGGGGKGTGTSAGPSPSAAPNPAPSPTPSQSPSPLPAPAPVPSPSPTPNPAPTPNAQGTKIQPPPQPPSVFYDGQLFPHGSVSDNLAPTTKPHSASVWLYVGLGLVLVLSAGGFGYWRFRLRPALPKAKS